MSKRILVFIYACIGFTTGAYAQDYQSLIRLAELKYKQAQYKDAAVLYEKAFEIEDGSPYLYYKAASSWAMNGDDDIAFDNLNSAIEKGFKKISLLKQDTTFRDMHADGRWKALLAKLQTQVDAYETSFNKKIRSELLAMQDEDQDRRKVWLEMEGKYGVNSSPADSMIVLTQATDDKNTKKLKEIIKTSGFPKKDSVGVEGVFAAFLIVQHTRDPALQNQCMPFLLEAAKAKDLKYIAVAIFQDKMLMKQGKKQMFGTQLSTNKQTGKKELYPIEDEANVNDRREEAGLPPLEDSLKKLGILYTPKE